MFRYIARRLLQMIPVLIGITIIIFAMLRMIPGDPVRIMLGVRATPERVDELRERLGLNEPVWVQYFLFVRNAAQGDLGDSSTQRRPVVELIRERVPVTIFLVAYGVVLSLAITVPLALLAALRRNTVADQLIRAVFSVTLAMPSFWVGLLLLLLLAVRWKLFPISGYGDTFVERLHHLFLPALTISLSLSALLIRNLRSAVIDVLRAPYVEFARAQGLRSGVVVSRYVLRNALVATVSIVGVNIGWLLSGSVVIETVFSLPGIGSTMINAIFARDYAVVQGITLLFGLLVLAVNLATDVAYAALDPRVSYD